MGGNVESVKQRLDITEVISGYVKLEKAGANWKARCPFHNEKTPSFFISPARQSYYCFGCGAKGDMFTFVQEMEGIDFKTALTTLADKAGVELVLHKGGVASKALKEQLLPIVSSAASFFEAELNKNSEARKYLLKRGVSDESIKAWRLGWAPDEWRSLYHYLLSVGFDKELIVRAGLAKVSLEKENKEPYDVFRGRIIFPLSDASGKIVGFSGRALGDMEPKYLNSPDTPLFAKSELLYGFDKAREDIRRKNYAILVEGQMDLILSHQAGVKNTVASSGTAFTELHLRNLKRYSPRIVLAFDGDSAGLLAAEKSATLALALGMEAKIARLPAGSDPAELALSDGEAWKKVLRDSLPAIEAIINIVFESEKDARKRSKLIEKKVLPLILLLGSAMEQSHYVFMVAKRVGLKEELVWEDLKKAKAPDTSSLENKATDKSEPEEEGAAKVSILESIELELAEVAALKIELGPDSSELERAERREAELKHRLRRENLLAELSKLTIELAHAEAVKDSTEEGRLEKKAAEIHKALQALEEEAKLM